MELGVPTISFGKPFNERVDGCGKVIPGPPEPKFPGVPPSFNPNKQMLCFGDNMKKEQYHLSASRVLEDKVMAAVGAEDKPGAKLPFGDILPGLESINVYVRKLGYERHPVSGSAVLREHLEDPGIFFPKREPYVPTPAQSQVHSNISSLLDPTRSSKLSMSRPSHSLSRLSSQAPPLQRGLSELSASNPLGEGPGSPSALARSASVPSGGLSPERARAARLRAMLLEASSPEEHAQAIPSKMGSAACDIGYARQRCPKMPFR